MALAQRGNKLDHPKGHCPNQMCCWGSDDKIAKAQASVIRAAKAWRKQQTAESLRWWPDNRIDKALARLEKLEAKNV